VLITFFVKGDKILVIEFEVQLSVDVYALLHLLLKTLSVVKLLIHFLFSSLLIAKCDSLMEL